MKWMVVGLAGMMGWMGITTSRGETAVTLPAGAGEHFTVQSVATNPLLRANANAVLTGTNVALGTMGTNLILQAEGQALGTMGLYYGAFGMVLGSNTVTYSGNSTVIGHGHSMFNAGFAGMWGGKGNVLTYGATQSGSLIPYQSAILGGMENKLYGTQNSVILGGLQNMVTNAAIFATLVGGYRNLVMGNNGTVVGGQYNEASGTNALAAGSYAKARHAGSFVWADSSTTSEFASSNDNEFAVRATGGVRFESELGTNAMSNKKSRYADNNIVAWARVVKDSGLSSSEHFGIRSVTNTAQGTYMVTLDTSMSSGYTLIPMAVVEVDSAPTNAGLARNIYVDQSNTISNFTVYITDGNHSLTNNDFLFMVTGR